MSALPTFFDGDAVGDDDDDWVSSLADLMPAKVPEKIKVTTTLPWGEDYVVNMDREANLNEVVTTVEGMFEKWNGQFIPEFYLSLDGQRESKNVKPLDPEKSLTAYGFKYQREILIFAEVKNKEKALMIFASEDEASDERKNRSVPGNWILIKLQGNKNIFPSKRGNVGFVMMKKKDSFLGVAREIGALVQSKSVKFKFDGEDIELEETPESLDVDDLDCIDFMA